MKSTGQCYSSGEVSGLSKCNISGELLLTSLVSIVFSFCFIFHVLSQPVASPTVRILDKTSQDHFYGFFLLMLLNYFL